MKYTTHDLVQGSPEWLEHRKTCLNASDAAAMLGLSSYKTRNQLIQEMATGITPEIDPMTQARMDRGHELEAAARPGAEAMLGQELFPATISAVIEGMKLGASLDGLVMDDSITWECKTLNQNLRAALQRKEIPEEYWPQMEQGMMISGASMCLFEATDGVDSLTCWYESKPELRKKIIAGWKQLLADVAAYKPTEGVIEAVGRAPEALPALRIELNGAVTASNLDEFKTRAIEVFRGIRTDLKTDQDFADADKTLKWCGDIEDRLAAAKEHALSQTQSIDALFKAIDAISAEARAKRLELEKLVTKRKADRKLEIISAGRTAYDQHVEALKQETGGPWIVLATPDFAGATKGLRSFESMQNAVDTALAQGKITADASAKKIRESLAIIKEAGAGFEILFPDKLALISKEPDDLRLLIQSRIGAHKKAEQEKADKIAAAARQKLLDEQAEEARKAAKPQVVEAPAPQPVEPPRAPAAHIPAATVQQSIPRPSSARLKLGEINARIAPLAVSADGLASLGFQSVGTAGAAKLYAESDFPLICRKLADRLLAAANGQREAA